MLHSTPKLAKDTNENFQRQGSLRKIIPPQHTKALFGRQNEDLNDFYKIFRQEYIILAEYKMLQSENLPGVYVVPSKESSLTWFGVIFVRSGLYEDGVFRFNIVLPESFPDCSHPKVVFQSEIYHPVIDEQNEVNLNLAFPVWNKGEQHIWQVLKYLHWIFYNVNSSVAHAVNQDIANLYKNNLEAFTNKVKNCVKESQEHLYDNPPTNDRHYIIFERYLPEKHDSVRNSILSQPINDRPLKLGHSWVSPGSFKPLTRPQTPESESET